MRRILKREGKEPRKDGQLMNVGNKKGHKKGKKKVSLRVFSFSIVSASSPPLHVSVVIRYLQRSFLEEPSKELGT